MYPTIQVLAKYRDADGTVSQTLHLMNCGPAYEVPTFNFARVGGPEFFKNVATFTDEKTAEAAVRSALETLPSKEWIEQWEFVMVTRSLLKLWD